MGWVEKFRKGLEGERMYQIEKKVKNLSVEPGVSEHIFIECSFMPGQRFGKCNFFVACHFGEGTHLGFSSSFQHCTIAGRCSADMLNTFRDLKMIGGNNTFGDYNVFSGLSAKTSGNTFGEYCEFMGSEFGDRNRLGNYSKFSLRTEFGNDCEFGELITLVFPILGDGAVFGRNCKIILDKGSRLGTYIESSPGHPIVIRV
jgi:hypothetical protein